MKSILLASASILAFAGAAAAEVTFGGSATLGYNDTDSERPDGENGETVGSGAGFFWDANIAVTASTMLDNDLTAAVSFDFDVADGNLGQTLEAGGFLLSLTSESAGLYFGDTAFAAETYWSPAGDMATDNFSEADGETVLRGEVVYGSVTAGLSYIIDVDTSFDANLIDGSEDTTDKAGTGDLVQLSLGATATFGNFTVGAAYQEAIDPIYLATQITDGRAVNLPGPPPRTVFINTTTAEVYNDNGDISNDEVFGAFGSTSFAGFDVSLAYSTNLTAETNSIGVAASYPLGPVTLGAAYVMESDTDDFWEVSADYASGPVTVSAYYDSTEDYGIDATYVVGNNITALAGFTDAGEDYYVGAEVGLGSDAVLGVYYADDGDLDNDDDIGGPELRDGATVEIGFSF